MRTFFSLIAVGLLALAPACGGDDSGTKPDLASATTHDLSVNMTDMPSVGTLHCGDLLVEANQCSDQACVAAVVAMGTAESQVKFNALFSCAKGQCGPPDSGVDVDGGAGTCSGPNDTTAACATCVKNAAGSNACSSEKTACFSDAG